MFLDIFFFILTGKVCCNKLMFNQPNHIVYLTLLEMCCSLSAKYSFNLFWFQCEMSKSCVQFYFFLVLGSMIFFIIKTSDRMFNVNNLNFFISSSTAYRNACINSDMYISLDFIYENGVEQSI